ncbi:epimerase [Microbacterium sp. 179-B 1A2 NHS]|uniref:epimerase n=1 Tax=Microbacterium sp. 179-B 1A2 NHS TaxID=3142383 RepID=UPI0039A3F1D5
MTPPAPRAVVAGAAGFIGTAITEALAADGFEVLRIGRAEAVRWGDQSAVDAAVDGAEVLVNLAGKSVDCRYTDRNRDEILASRVETTRALAAAVRRADAPPRVWLNASTATIYRHATDRPHTEANGERGTGFSVDVAREWEAALFAGELPGTRRVALRMAIVVGNGPATRMLLTLARLGLAGPQFDGWVPRHRRYRGIGSHPTGDTPPSYRTGGRQRFSWVHIDDVVAAVRFLIARDDIDGVVNVSGPTPTDNRTLMRTLRQVVGAPLGIPSRRWMLEAAMWALRTEPELLLKSRWVLPGRLEAAGFVFRRTDLTAALAEVHAARRVRR